ncbi:hypothetical protein FQN54_000875 [Arachnomyces sp. PD_36]|nr:hypothetical protein FQN54_000875 [Arachnomyces sp. PD_36]
MSASSRAVQLLSAARVAVREARGNLAKYELDTIKLETATPRSNDYMVRTSLSQNIISVAENLNGVKDASIRSQFPKVFGGIYDIVGQRNILAHQYGHADEKIDWGKIWTTIHDTYPELESAIDNAIEELELVD